MKHSLWISLAAACWLTACGGGGDDTSAHTPAPPTAQVPASASSSVAGLLDYLKALVTSEADTLEPVSLVGFSPTTSDTEEPRALN